MSDQVFRKVKFDNGMDIHLTVDDDGQAIRADIAGRHLSVELRIPVHEAGAVARALTDLAKLAKHLP